VLAVAAVSAELRAILLNRIFKILRFLCRFINCAHIGQFFAEFCADVRIPKNTPKCDSWPECVDRPTVILVSIVGSAMEMTVLCCVEYCYLSQP